jgi:hypothetical protein
MARFVRDLETDMNTLARMSIAVAATALVLGIAVAVPPVSAKSLRSTGALSLVPKPSSLTLSPKVRKLKARCIQVPVQGVPRKRKMQCFVG